MIFTYKKWEEFCKTLNEKGFHSISAQTITKDTKNYIVLKHDVETDVKKAFHLAKLEKKYGHQGTYYIQAYLLEDPQNIEMLKSMQEMGHEISYHYDVMDACKGDLDAAIKEFENNKRTFETHGFFLETLCQHGNPVVERKGYTSNRDFFRSEKVQLMYPELSDIMVNYQEKHQTEYLYYSDAGRKFKLIYDPLYNDIVNSDDKNIIYSNLEELLAQFDEKNNYIVSIHPHRWTNSAMMYLFKTCVFFVVKYSVKILRKLPFVKGILNRYYYLAKKF